MLVGENGIITQAQTAKENTELAKSQEKEDMAKLEDEMNEAITGIEVEQVTDTNPGILEGNGTQSDPYVINSIEDLVFFAYDVTNGNTYEEKTVRLGLSLDFNSTKSYVEPFSTAYGKYGYDGELKTSLTSGEGFIPIGMESDEVGTNSFSGIFDGQGKSIKNLYINEKSETDSKLGFFAINYGIIENLNLVDINITRYEEKNSLSGGLTGQNRANGTIINCMVSGNIKIDGIGSAAGITGHNLGKIENCCNLANITIESKGRDLEGISVGGVTCSSGDFVSKCFNSGNLNLMLEGNLIKRTIITVGGISTVSRNTQECYNTGNINVKIIGSGEQTVEVQVGGIAGSSDYEISNCYNVGNIEASSNIGLLYEGGITGKTISGNDEAINQNCYNVGEIKGNCEDILYLGGITATAITKVNNCYYLNQDNFTNTGTEAGTVKTKEEMNQEIFVDLLNGGNDEVVWKYEANENNGYPILNWQHNPTMDN